MNMRSDSNLLSALTAERAALAGFVRLLEREQDMLVENSTDQLLELSVKKTSDALGLNRLVETRRSMLRESASQPAVSAILKEVTDLTERARQLNLINGQMIQAKLRHNQSALAVLAKAANQADIYGPDGQPGFSPGNGRSLGSG